MRRRRFGLSADVASINRGLGFVGGLLAVAGPLAVSGLLVGFRSDFPAANAALVLVLVVLGAAIVGGRGGGAVAAVVSAVCFDFFFTRPYYSFTINSRDDIETTIVLLAVGLAVGELVVRSRRSRQAARDSRRQIDQIRRVAELSAGGPASGRLIDVVRRELVDLLGASSARFERVPFRSALPRLGHDRVSIPADDERRELPIGPRNEVEVPVWGRGRSLGRIVLVFDAAATGVAIPPDDRVVAVALADQLGAVLAAASETN
jgi:hypothetical protein